MTFIEALMEPGNGALIASLATLHNLDDVADEFGIDLSDEEE